MSLLGDTFTTSFDGSITVPSETPVAMEDDLPSDGQRYRNSGAELTLDVQKMSGFSLRRKKPSTTTPTQRQSKTPPDSPKAPREVGGVGRKGAGIRGVGAGGKSGGRKQYATLMENDSNGEDDDDFFLLSKGHVAREKRTSSVGTRSHLTTSGEMTMPTRFVNPVVGVPESATTSEGFPVRFTPPKEARFPNFDFTFDSGISTNVLDLQGHVTEGTDQVFPPPDSKGHMTSIPPPDSKGHMTSIPPPDSKGHLTSMPPSDSKGHMTSIPPHDSKGHTVLNPSPSIGFTVPPLNDPSLPSLPPPPPLTTSSLPPPLSSSSLTFFQPSPPQPRPNEGHTPLSSTNSGQEESDWSVSDELYQKCTLQFNGLQPEGGYLSGEKARDFFLRSNLPVEELSKIWKLSDIDRDGKLTQEEFVVAMKLVLMRRKKFDIPSTLPEALIPKERKSPMAPVVPPPIAMATLPDLLSTDSDSAPPRPPPPTFLSSAHRTKTEPSIAISGATPTTVDHVLVGGKPYAKVNIPNKSKKKGEEKELILNDYDINDNTFMPTEQVGVSLGTSPLPEPAIARLVSVDTGGEDTTGDEDETSNLVAGATVPGNAPVPKPRKKRRPPNQGKVTTELHRAHTVHGRGSVQGGGASNPPPRPPAPYKGRSPVHVLATPTSNEPHVGETPSVEVVVPMVTKVIDNSIGDEKNNKGHGRSTSWDLTKMLKEHVIVHQDLPSAEPPKLPPRKNISPSSDDETSTSSSNKKSQSVSTLQRSASTGSIASVGLPTPLPALKQPSSSRSPSIDSDNLLLAAESLLPRASTVSEPNRRPAPAPPPSKSKPAVPKKPLYPPSYKKVTTPIEKSSEGGETEERSPLSMETYKKKTKMELQMSVKQLKDENEVYSRMNKELSQKLQELIEQRVKLEVKLDSFKRQSHTH